MVESWKSIPGYEGLYEASTFGNIRSLELRVAYKDGRFRVQAGRILKHGDQVGYARVNLAKNGKIFPCLVHRLIAKTFLSNDLNHPYVNHIDSNKRNNNIENLEWCTASHNFQHSVKSGRNNYVQINISKKSPVSGTCI